MELPNVDVPPEILLNEYHRRHSDISAANIRLVGMIHVIVAQRNSALKRCAELEEQLRGRESAQEAVTRIGNPPGLQPPAS